MCDNIHKLIVKLCPYQHGFVPKKSFLTNLLESFQNLIHSIDGAFGVDIMYLVYKQAFDSVPHHRVLHKFEGYCVLSSVMVDRLLTKDITE